MTQKEISEIRAEAFKLAIQSFRGTYADTKDLILTAGEIYKFLTKGL